ncbi:MAG: AraC family transcriptional regulator [Clostridia bacterium]|nr:AraC family transcriptional regulator [Clostridia bacterium]
MYSQFQNYELNNDDFNVVQFGFRECLPKFCVYHRRCQNYLLHYTYSGKGEFHVNNTDYSICENQMFIVYPGQETWYTSDKDDPFSYRWVEFYGNQSYEFLQTVGLTVENPVYTATPPYESARLLKEMVDVGVASKFRLTGLFWMFANSMLKENTQRLDHIGALFGDAVKYIHANVEQPTTVEDVASHIGVTRGYLFKIFKSCIDLSPKQYIVRYHMNEAKSLLMGTDMPIYEIAAAVGYQNPADFTKAFARLFEKSPSDCRREANRDTPLGQDKNHKA